MKLSIIIPCNYNTLQNQTLNSMFNSINNQVHVNWEDIEIILVHPYPQYKFDMNEYAQLKQSFKSYYIKKSTYGSIKQFGLDIAQGDYILFLMPNTILYSMTTIIDTLQKITDKFGEDCFFFNVGNCLQLNNNNNIELNNSLFNLEGKIFRKDFLINNNICFLEHLTSSEDIYFTQKFQNCNPQYSIETSMLVLEIFPLTPAVPIEEEYLNNLDALTLLNRENIIIKTNQSLSKVVELLLQIYESLYSYKNEEYQNIIKTKLKNFILELHSLININAIFAKCSEVSNNYNNIDVIRLNNDITFYEFVSSIFSNEEQNQEAKE